MTPERHRVYLEDEAPRLGCGWRNVIARVGRKWVHLRLDVADERLQFRQRIKKSVWTGYILANKSMPQRRVKK